eukprot:420556-Pyramimonas_sp.AAC.3
MPRPKGKARLNVALRTEKKSRQTQSARETLPFARGETRQGAPPSAGHAPAAQVSFLAARIGVHSAIADEHEAQNERKPAQKKHRAASGGRRAERA